MKSLFHRPFLALSNIAQTQRAHGVDVSKYDKFFRPETATGQLDFAIQRIGYGIFMDEAFDILAEGVMRVPIRGGYHYLSSGVSWQAQADVFLKNVEGFDYHFFVCDFEGYYNKLSLVFAYEAYRWIQYIANHTKKKVLLYTNPSHYDEYIAPSAKEFKINWDAVDLWLGQYWFTPDPNKQPGLPKSRKSWNLWQYTSNGDGTKYGMARSAACDLNVFNGSVADMRAWLGLGNSPVPPPPVPQPYPKIQLHLTLSNGQVTGTYTEE